MEDQLPSKSRPQIETIRDGAELRRWYWLKEELIDFCRKNELHTTGRKIDLVERIVEFLASGKRMKLPAKKTKSKFDWGKTELTLSTIITDNYRNSQNVRRFFCEHAGATFRFSNEFMDWMRKNQGSTLGDAVDFWKALDHKKKNLGYREKPLPQNEYNQFTRAISEAVPGLSSKEIRRLWAIKRSKPGPHRYEPGDENV